MKKYFITGLLTLLPLAVTFWVVRFLIELLTKPFIGLVSLFTYRLSLIPPQLLKTVTQAIILIALFIFIFFLGLLARRFFFSQLIALGDKILNKIPLVNKVYKTSKDLVLSLFNAEEKSFQQVVLLPFPYKGSYCIGLITKSAPNAQNNEKLSVFIPTCPNPSTGFLVSIDKSDLIYLKMKTEEAIKYVVSCAVIQPKDPE